MVKYINGVPTTSEIVEDNKFKILDDADPSKAVVFTIDDVAPSTTVAFRVPSTGGTLVTNENWTDEATARANADSTLTTNLNAEITARANADSTLHSSINNIINAIIVTDNATASAGRLHAVDTTATSITITAPASPTAGMWFDIYDAKNTFFTNNLTIERNGKNIMGSAANYISSTNGNSYRCIYIDDTYGWDITTQDCWDDLKVPLYSRGGGTAPTFANGFAGNSALYTWNFSNSNINNMYFEVQLPHSWKGNTIYPHVHWSPTTTGTGTVRWRLEYTWVNINGTFGASSTVDMEDVVSTASQWKHLLAGTVSGITPTTNQNGISSQLVCRLYRDPNVTTGSNLAASVALVSIDFHYQLDTFGSRQMTAR